MIGLWADGEMYQRFVHLGFGHLSCLVCRSPGLGRACSSLCHLAPECLSFEHLGLGHLSLGHLSLGHLSLGHLSLGHLSLGHLIQIGDVRVVASM